MCGRPTRHRACRSCATGVPACDGLRVRLSNMHNRCQVMAASTGGGPQVGPSSFFRLMRAGEAVLLYPGGAREVGHRRRDAPES